MTVIYIITHGEMGKYIVNTSRMIIGKQEDIKIYSLMPDVSVDELKVIIAKEIYKDLEEEKNILILLDVIGGSPFNMIIPFLKEENIECVAGINLPMLLEVLINRDKKDIKKLAELAHKEGRDGVVNIREMLENNMKGEG